MFEGKTVQLRSLCVFCGSSVGANPRWVDAARRLGRALAEHDVTLVFGGGHLGMMGAMGEAVMANGGRAIGFIPEHLTRIERAFTGITELHVVDSMHTRKRRMFGLADAFAMLPGGMGTLDETFEMLTWKQLRLHHKPFIVVNQEGYWTPWLDLVGHLVASGYAHAETRRLFKVVDDVDQVIPTARAELARALHGEPHLF